MSTPRALSIPAAVAVLSIFGVIAHASTFPGMFLTIHESFLQTGSVAPTVPSSLWMSVVVANPNNAAPPAGLSDVMTYPGPDSPETSFLQTGTAGIFTSPTYGSAAAFGADYPFGDYTVTQSDATGAVTSGTIPYSAAAISGAPYLELSSYESLEQNAGQSPINGLVVHLPTLVSGEAASLVGTITSGNSQQVLSYSFANSVSSDSDLLLSIAPFQLQPGTDYNLDLLLTQTDFVAGAGSLTWQSETTLPFTALSAVPEPSTLALTLLGIVFAGIVRHRL